MKEQPKKRICTNCKHEFDTYGRDTMRICKKCNCARVKSLSVERKMRNRAQQRSKNKDIIFDLNNGDIIVPKRCPVFGFELVCKTGSPGGSKTSPSLDRIDPDKGYVKDNIRVISHLANCMKANATPEELIKFAKWVLENYEESGED